MFIFINFEKIEKIIQHNLNIYNKLFYIELFGQKVAEQAKLVRFCQFNFTNNLILNTMVCIHFEI